MSNSSPRSGTRATRASRRFWLVLVLLVGILGMHGLASDHAPTAAAEPVPAAPAVEVDATGMTGVAGMAGMAGMAGAAPDTGADSVVVTGVGRPGQHVVSMVGLCVAVLAGSLLLLIGARQQQRAARARDPLPARVLARLRALPPRRPPDLVAGLCVSRT